MLSHRRRKRQRSALKFRCETPLPHPKPPPVLPAPAGGMARDAPSERRSAFAFVRSQREHELGDLDVEVSIGIALGDEAQHVLLQLARCDSTKRARPRTGIQHMPFASRLLDVTSEPKVH